MTTETITKAKQALAEHGVAILPDVLSPSEVADVRERLLVAADRSDADGVPIRGYAFDPDEKNRRVFHLFNYDEVFVDLIQHPLALDFVRATIGDSFLISNFSANITAPGSGAMQLHADQGYVLPPWPSQPLACNVAWILDDYSEENGATRYVPDSHLLGHGPAPECDYETVAVEATAGSIMVMDGRLWHQSGVNRSVDCHRAALFGYYVVRWLRPQINWNAALTPTVVKTLSPEFLHLLGYYTGNVESLIPSGANAQVELPASIAAADGQAFPLDNE